MKNLPKREWILALVAGLLLAGCSPRGAQGAPQRGIAEVGVVTVQTERVVLATELPGRTAAYRVADIRPQVSGLIVKRAFEEGSLVKEGDLLYQVDPTQYQASYDHAKAAVALSEASLPAARSREERYKELVASRAIGEQEYDDALAALRQAEAQLEYSKAALEIAAVNLSYTPIKSPISGRIGRSSVTEGAIVTAYQPVPLATVQQLDPIYVDVPQSTSEMLKLQRRMEGGKFSSDNKSQNKVAIIREDGTPYPQQGTLEFRDVTVNPTTGSVILRVVVPNPDSALLPGMFVRAVIEEGIIEDGILVIQSCVGRNQKGEPFALVVDESGKAAMRMLAIDRAIGNKWLVSSGLAAGDRVITEGLQRVRPGVPVAIAPVNSGSKDKDQAVNPNQPKQKTK
ncbi:MAG TPA: efflux RND transporter periplasmic adaptor subunit [Candidatus Omnitrophota bacterium]|nr:efflux RND transporter periplasmic adaptor subunit [Candidatus Omnitrophota bacterium]HPD84719.1 efflux RND transporter periplasmic adaptor subunit [Candidatus Omnitrophota bacterium]HRZ03577.1 efflux RND transporter periplasmic adaptor subunit [Candidatus Omnitrophota bacterium]